MNERQTRFVDHYIQTGNGSEAARRAGYSAKTAYSIAEENLRKPEILSAIKKRLSELSSERIAEAQEVLEHLTAVLRGEESEIIVTNSGKKFKVPVSERDRLKAAEMLLKVSGTFREKVDVQIDGAELFLNTLQKVEERTRGD